MQSSMTSLRKYLQSLDDKALTDVLGKAFFLMLKVYGSLLKLQNLQTRPFVGFF